MTTNGDHAGEDAGESGGGSAAENNASPNPLRGSRTSKAWIAVAAIGVLLVLLVVFVAQNTTRVRVRFLGWSGSPPLAVAILIGALVGLALALCAGTLRIWQIHRRVRRTEHAAR